MTAFPSGVTTSKAGKHPEPQVTSPVFERSSPPGPHSHSSEVPEDLSIVTMVPDEYELTIIKPLAQESGVVSTEAPASSSAEQAEMVGLLPMLCRVNRSRVYLPPQPTSRDEAESYLRNARIVLLNKVGYSHPLFWRTKSNGSLEEDMSSENPVDSNQGDEAVEDSEDDEWADDSDDDMADEAALKTAGTCEEMTGDGDAT